MARQTFDPSSASYSDFSQEQNYDYDPGVVVLPVAGPTAAYKRIRLHGGLGRRVVNWRAARSGKPPIIPSMADAGEDRFLGGHVQLVTAGNPQVAGYNWDVSGTYTYVQSSPRIVGVDTLNAGTYPYPQTTADDLGGAVADPGVAAAAGEVTLRNKIHKFALAVSPEKKDRDSDTYVWPFTLLPPTFTNDYLIGG